MSSYIKLRAELYLNFTCKIKNIRHNSEQTAYRNDFSFVLVILLISKKIDRVKRFINKKTAIFLKPPYTNLNLKIFRIFISKFITKVSNLPRYVFRYAFDLIYRRSEYERAHFFSDFFKLKTRRACGSSRCQNVVYQENSFTLD